MESMKEIDKLRKGSLILCKLDSAYDDPYEPAVVSWVNEHQISLFLLNSATGCTTSKYGFSFFDTGKEDVVDIESIRRESPERINVEKMFFKILENWNELLQIFREKNNDPTFDSRRLCEVLNIQNPWLTFLSNGERQARNSEQRLRTMVKLIKEKQ